MIAAIAASLALAAAAAAGPAHEPQAVQTESKVARPSAGDVAKFLLGGAAGLALHESGHVIAAAAFGADPGVKGIRYGFIPFFAITHDQVSPGREYTISSAGFWMQSLSSEWLLTAKPEIRREHAPLAKGLLAFDVLAFAIYGCAGMAHIGPPERDTRSMAISLRVNESWVGAAVLSPAVFDTWRYASPERAFPRWASRVSKAALVLLVIRAAS